MPAKISVLIPFYNCPYIGRAIESTLQQTYSNVEITVIDDGSTEHTALIGPYIKQIRYIRKTNGGTASALNKGIRMANGEYIAWLSSDDVYLPDKLERQLVFMKEFNAAVSFTDFDIIDAAGQLVKPSAGSQFPPLPDLFPHMLEGNLINGCTMVIKKELLLQFNLFDESLPYTHDYDMWCRLLLSGTKFFYMNKSTVRYRKHDRAGSVRHMEEIKRETALIKARYESRLIARISGADR
jgi:teichuronic acid biosynthesis glycosyltransferase TuaG